MTIDGTIIADSPPAHGREWDCQCAHCGSSCMWMDCWDCAGDGSHDNGQRCSTCRGRGGWDACMSSPEWCDAHPLEGRGTEHRNQIEWFATE